MFFFPDPFHLVDRFQRKVIQFLANPYVVRYNKNMCKKIYCCLLIIFFLPLLVGWFGNWRRMMKSGNEAYWNLNYEAATEAFHQATLDKPNNSIAYHNLGTALYKKGRYQQAAAAFHNSILKGNVPNEAAVYYNLGNSHFQMGDLKAAIESYKYSLRLNPIDVDVKYNLALALELLNTQKQNVSPQLDSPKEQDSPKNKPHNLSKPETLQFLERLSKIEGNRRQKILKQQLNTGYRRDKDW